MKKLKARLLLMLANFGLFVMNQKPEHEHYDAMDLLHIEKLRAMRRQAYKVLR